MNRTVALVFSVLLCLGLFACGEDGVSVPAGSGEVSIVADSGPEGYPGLVKGDSASGSQNQRVPVTRRGVPTVIYKLPVRDMKPDMRIRAMATVTLTKCAITDYIPHNRENTACQGTREYSYSPVEIETTFKFVGGKHEPDLAGPSVPLGGELTTRCTTAVHHCSISQELEFHAGGRGLASSKQAAEFKWIVFEATASSPRAGGCKQMKPADCNVLAVETQKGTAMYFVQADEGADELPDAPSTREVQARTLPVLTGHGDKNEVRKVVYSLELASEDEIDDLAGRQYEFLGAGRVIERLPQAPDIAGYVVLSDSPTGIEGRYLISDTYDPDKTGNNGGNCDRRCSAKSAMAATTILPCDVDAGRRYVNVVLSASRARAKKGETVRVGDGFFRASHAYPASVGGGIPSEASCSR